MIKRSFFIAGLVFCNCLALSSPALADTKTPAKLLGQVNSLSQGAVESIDTALQNYGGMIGFGDDYAMAARGILESLIAEWEVHDQIAQIAQHSSDARLVDVMKLLKQAETTNTRFVKRTNLELAAIATTRNAVRYRQQQVTLYDDLQNGLLRDKGVLTQIAKISKP